MRGYEQKYEPITRMHHLQMISERVSPETRLQARGISSWVLQRQRRLDCKNVIYFVVGFRKKNMTAPIDFNQKPVLCNS